MKLLEPLHREPARWDAAERTNVKPLEALHPEPGGLARAYLARRGLDDAAFAQGRELVLRLQQIEPCDSDGEPDVGVDPVEARAAHDAMWNWYLEWSGYARAALDQDLCRRVLGLGKRAQRASSGGVDAVTQERAK